MTIVPGLRFKRDTRFRCNVFVLIFRGFIERLGLFLGAVYCWIENGVLGATTGVRLLERRENVIGRWATREMIDSWKESNDTFKG